MVILRQIGGGNLTSNKWWASCVKQVVSILRQIGGGQLGILRQIGEHFTSNRWELLRKIGAFWRKIFDTLL
jgi:hypothetical protein